MYLNPIQDELFWGCSWMGGTFLKSATHPTAVKLGTIISYLRKIQKMYELRERSPELG